VDSDFKVDTFTFYNPYGGSSGIGCAFTVSWTNAAGQTSTKGISQEASINFVKPTVDKFDAKWANWPLPYPSGSGTIPPVAVRHANPANNAPLEFALGGWEYQKGYIDGVFGENFLYSNGITWTADVNPIPNTGGEIAFFQLLTTDETRTKENGTQSTKKTGDIPVMDGAFPYDSVPIGTTLVSSDSPGYIYATDDTMYKCDMYYDLYLMYKPEGNDSIWVSLSLMKWNWGGKTTRKDVTETLGDQVFHFKTWEIDSLIPRQLEKNDTSILPEWTKNITSIDWV